MLQLNAKVRANACQVRQSKAVLRTWGGIFRAIALSVAIALQLGIGIAAHGQGKPSEFDVKAAYLLSFGKFMRTGNAAPTGSREVFEVCVLGEDKIVASLTGLAAGQTIENRPVKIVRVKEGAQARNCEIAYVSESEGAKTGKDLEEMRGADVLTVGNGSTFLAQGGMIQFLLLSNHVRFAVNLEAVHNTHLVLSSELLRVAYSIAGKPLTEVAP